MNIVYLHAHDAGRWVQPYGLPVETPHLMRFAQQGVLFRKAFCTAPSCGPSRAALLTGQYPHQVGMFGLPGPQGWLIDNYDKHLVNRLNSWGYQTVLAGVQHEASHEDHFPQLAYERVLEREEPARNKDGEWYPETIAKVESFLATRNDPRPFFLSVGIDEPHRNNGGRPEMNIDNRSGIFSHTRYYDPERLDSRYTAPPPWLPDLPEIRKDMESYREGVRLMDDYMGRVLYAVEQNGYAQNTLVIVTTDHGIEFPGSKKTLTDKGIGVMLIIRGPHGTPFTGGQIIEPMVSHLDIYPTLCELLGKTVSHRLEGRSLLPLLRGEIDTLHEEIFAEQTYHGSLEPLRCIRTERYKMVKRHFEVGPQMRHDGPSSTVLERCGWYDRPVGHTELFDLYLDPQEACNRADDPAFADILSKLEKRLSTWMADTKDCFPDSAFPPLPKQLKG